MASAVEIPLEKPWRRCEGDKRNEFAEYTHLNNEGVKTRGKADRRQRAVRVTRFLDHRLMFDSERSFSLKYDLILPPY